MQAERVAYITKVDVVVVNHNNQPQTTILFLFFYFFIHTCLLPILVVVVNGRVGLLIRTLPVVYVLDTIRN